MNRTFFLPRLMPRDRQICNIVDVLEDLPAESGWRVEIHENKSGRSAQQNRYLWGVVYPTITERLDGWESEDVHEYCLGEWSGWETVVGLGKKRLRPVRRSSKLSKLEFAEYVEFIQRRMAGFGIVIPDPDPAMREEEAA